MSKIPSKFIQVFSVVDGYAYTGSEVPATHEKSDLFLNISNGTYSTFENNAWSEAVSAEGKTFISANENKIYSVVNGSVTYEQPDNFSLYLAVINQKLLCCYDNNIY